jgi:hypothetical protein
MINSQTRGSLSSIIIKSYGYENTDTFLYVINRNQGWLLPGQANKGKRRYAF